MNKSQSKYFNTAVKMDLALLSLLKRKPLEYLTVKELCEEAGVNRSTFYLHYDTLQDLVMETVGYLLDSFLAYFQNNCKLPSPDLFTCEDEQVIFVRREYLIPYLTYIRDNKEIFLTALLHSSTFGFNDIYKQLYESILDPIFTRFHYPSDSRKYVAMYYLNGINAITLQWLEDDCRKPLEEISDIIQMCVFGRK